MESPSSTYFDQKTVVVTGAAGFIGSHLCDWLLDRGSRVIGLDNLITGNLENLSTAEQKPNFEFRNQDVMADPAVYLSDLAKIDYVFHFASPASPPIYQKYPVETYLVNSQATHQLLAFLKEKHLTARFIFASTSEVYGDPQVHPQAEDYWGNVNPNGPRSCYDEAKRMGETICGVFNRDLDMDTRIVRIFNTYGPRMDLEDGRVIPSFIKAAMSGEKFQIFGSEDKTRSYCYVEDLVAGILEFAGRDELSGETMNLGNPGEFSLLETAKMVHQVAGRVMDESVGDFDQLVDFQPDREDDPQRRQPDTKKAQELIGWGNLTDFEQGLEATLSYFLKKG